MNRFLILITIILLGLCCRKSQQPAPPTESEVISAVLAGRTAVLDSLLTAGADPNARDMEGTPALILAVNKGYDKMVRLLVTAGADVNARRAAYFHSTALMEVSIGNNAGLAAWLIEKGADWRLRDSFGDPALNWAAYYGNLPVVKLLLEEGAKWSDSSRQGNAVDIAILRGHQDLVQFFVDQGAGEELEAIAEQLLAAVRENDVDGVRQALYIGADPRQTDPLGTPALVLAAELGHDEMIRYLLRKGARHDDFNRVGQTALARAARFGHRSTVAYLLSKGADPELAGEKYRQSPLIGAAQGGHADIIRMLLEAGADPDHQEGISGFTPLMIATAEGHLESVRVLLEAGASPYIKSFEGAGLYDMLRYSNSTDIAALLQKHLLEE